MKSKLEQFLDRYTHDVIERAIDYTVNDPNERWTEIKTYDAPTCIDCSGVLTALYHQAKVTKVPNRSYLPCPIPHHEVDREVWIQHMVQTHGQTFTQKLLEEMERAAYDYLHPTSGTPPLMDQVKAHSDLEKIRKALDSDHLSEIRI
jgi:hypothetical protein